MVAVLNGPILEHTFATLCCNLIKPKLHTKRRTDCLPRLLCPVAVYNSSNIVIQHVKAWRQWTRGILILNLNEQYDILKDDC